MNLAPQDHKRTVGDLVRELSYARGENRRLRQRIKELEDSRDRWKQRALRRGT